MNKFKLILGLTIFISSTQFYGQKIVEDPRGWKYAVKDTFATLIEVRNVGGIEGQFNDIYVPDKVWASDNKGHYTDYTINRIGEYAFKGCKGRLTVELPKRLKYIGKYAFEGTSIYKIVIPSEVETMDTDGQGNNVFTGCKLDGLLVYSSEKPPKGWVKAQNTYVPDLIAYESSSAVDIDRYGNTHNSLSKLITFNDTVFAYTGNNPTTTWTSNLGDYDATLTMPILHKEIGYYKELIPVKFENKYFPGMEITVNVVYRYSVKKPLKVKVEDASREYGEKNPEFKISYEGFEDNDGPNVLTGYPVVSTTATHKSDVGQYPITIKYPITISGGYDRNYIYVGYEPGTLTITKANATIKVRDTSRLYGTQNPLFNLDFEGLKNGETDIMWVRSPKCQTSATWTSNVGRYEVNITNAIAKNYNLTFKPGYLTIEKAPLEIIANNAERLYYEENPKFTYTCRGLANDEDSTVLTTAPTLATTAIQTSKVGTYPITIGGAEALNYDIKYAPGTLQVNKRPLKVSVKDYSRPYNENNPKFELVYEGFVNDEDVSSIDTIPQVTTNITKDTPVGRYRLEASGGKADNYYFVYKNGYLTINKAYQTVAWNQDLNEIGLYSQVLLGATASSGLPITYKLNTDTVCNINVIGEKIYLDCFHHGKVTIIAYQEGDRNYWPSTRLYKEATVLSTVTDIKDVTKSKDGNKIFTQEGRIIIFGNNPEKNYVKVYGITGELVYSGRDCDIQVPHGVYIVKIGAHATKVLVK